MSLNLEKYQALATLLEQVRCDTTSTPVTAPHLRKGVSLLQQMFRQQIVPLPAENSRVQSYRTEISKQLRLLEIDVMFLQGSRQASTAEGRLKTISDRLTTLIQYCEAILQQEPEEEK
ncbi:heterocyst frequency control protein PatD [Nodularia sp. UHCC 0506]|uniref:heterocyst frequency control protein PatD n=1 Tax=Nodularia sp. UHCC 0506 TaxID=3110243 RepID=UPI002B1FE191|nr:heterocyst frequency control protein PatD [Nodularia sp. UHCC 0506]MEA5514369.1 heterocyst frequency control protein PatD [Nodularia sp. UHCC 0506]